MTEAKSNYWWSVKGICIIAVILIHGVIGLNFDNQYAFIMYRQFINFPVAVFVFLAGYFVNKKKALDGGGKTYVFDRVKKLLIPYTFFYAVYMLWNISQGARPNWKGMVVSYILGSYEVHAYYLLMLMQLVILTPFILKFIDNKLFRSICMLASFTAVGIKHFELYKQSDNPYAAHIGTIFITWLVFYVYGMYASTLNKAEESSCKNIKTSVLVSLLIFTFLLTEAESIYMLHGEVYRQYAVSQVKLSSYIFDLVLMTALLYLEKREIKLPKLLVDIGKKSFGIYLLHMLVMNIINKIHEVLHLQYDTVTRYMITAFLTLAITYIIITIFIICRKNIEKRV